MLFDFLLLLSKWKVWCFFWCCLRGHNESIDLYEKCCWFLCKRKLYLWEHESGIVVSAKWIFTHLFWLINYKSSVIANHRVAGTCRTLSVIVLLASCIQVENVYNVHPLCNVYIILLFYWKWVPAMTYHRNNNNNVWNWYESVPE